MLAKKVRIAVSATKMIAALTGGGIASLALALSRAHAVITAVSSVRGTVAPVR